MEHGRIATLEERHARLDRTIETEAHRPGSDDIQLARLKRERLSLKDQLAGMAAA
jgi:hypothetical protein